MPFGEALPGASAGGLVREAQQQLPPERISVTLIPLRFGGLGVQQQAHRCEGSIAPSLAPEAVAAVGHQQCGATALVGVGRPAVHAPKIRGGNRWRQGLAPGPQQVLTGDGHRETEPRCGDQQHSSEPGSRGHTVARTVGILKCPP